MTEKFRKFLKDNDAYDKYVKNNKGKSNNPFTDFDAFVWSKSDEGYNYWNNLDCLWYDILCPEDSKVL